MTGCLLQLAIFTAAAWQQMNGNGDVTALLNLFFGTLIMLISTRHAYLQAVSKERHVKQAILLLP